MPRRHTERTGEAKTVLTGSEQLKTVAATHVACANFTLPGLQHKKIAKSEKFFYYVMASEPALRQVAMRAFTSPLRLVTRILAASVRANAAGPPQDENELCMQVH